MYTDCFLLKSTFTEDYYSVNGKMPFFTDKEAADGFLSELSDSHIWQVTKAEILTLLANRMNPQNKNVFWMDAAI